MSKKSGCPCKKTVEEVQDSNPEPSTSSGRKQQPRSRCRVMFEKLRPAPDITMFDKDPFADSPLMKFRAAHGRTRAIQDRLKNYGAEQMRLLREKRTVRPPSTTMKIPESEDVPRAELRKHVNENWPPPMLKSWERDMARRVPAPLRLKYGPLLNSLMEDAKAEFNEGLRILGIRRLLQPQPYDDWPQLEPPGFRFDGRTERYPLFLKRRTRLERTLFPLRKFMRGILHKSVTMLPNHLNDYTQYRKQGMMDFNRLRGLMSFDLRKGEMLITNGWFPKIVAGFKQEWLSKTIPDKLRPRYLKCIQGYICLHIIQTMQRTIEHAIDVSFI